MSKKNILTVGFSICDDDVEFSDFDSEQSLLDWDIIIFKPEINDFLRGSSLFQGRPCLTDDHSFRLKEQVEHWRREIKAAVEHGKLVLVYLTELCEVSVATGKKEFSGTGKNQKVTRIVENYSNYQAIPAQLNAIKTKGKEVKLSPKGGEIIASYWREFGDISSYKVVLGDQLTACVVTKHGDKPVGAVAKSKDSNGALVLLPDVDFYADEYFGEDGEWNAAGRAIAAKLVSAVVAMDKALRNEGELTPEPDWVKDDCFKLTSELAATQELLLIEKKMEAIQTEKDAALERLKKHGRLRKLLFEKGKPLEYAILDALEILGFKVEQFNDGNSEFDAVFTCKEGRLIGEVEGKDNKAVNVEKLRQLALNIHEDLARDEIDAPAKGVLFGNSYRLQPLSEREVPFTTKCISAAVTSSTALVPTPELFKAAKYLSDKRDSRFAKRCRNALLSSVGIVQFPEILDGCSEPTTSRDEVKLSG
ncbi:hypothetical protein MCB86_11450 [Pseudomonas sp. KSR10]|uniref:hypothetical protein n=1 Tax=Pseudomonas sp. KSR10 TaxID=2916654 RepID=UPI001EF95EA3|nr:hypothetical protein [Pseudomonas sp. KSR10]MCG6540687.1 hypothetical protein [Pseudomonas sp. KSR10]